MSAANQQHAGSKEPTGQADRPGSLRIAVIAEDLQPPLDEGAKKSCFHLMRALESKGNTVTVYTRCSSPDIPGAVLLPGNKLLWGRSFARRLREQAPHFILYVPSSSGTLGAFIRAFSLKAQSGGAPLALLNLQYRGLPLAPRYMGVYRSVDVAFAQAQASAEVLRSRGCRTVLLSGGVDSTRFKPVSAEEKRSLRRQYGFQEDDRVILHVGHANADRNILTLAHLAEMGYHVALVTSTSTTADSSLLGQLRQAGVQVITHYIEDIQHYYQLADCYLFPVFHANSAIDAPLSVLEAMACNIPVVSTRFGALPGMFRPGKGLYFAECQEDLYQLVDQAVAEPGCHTLDLAAPYSWGAAADTMIGAFLSLKSRMIA